MGYAFSIETIRCRPSIRVYDIKKNAGVAIDCLHYSGENCVYFLLTLNRFT